VLGKAFIDQGSRMRLGENEPLKFKLMENTP
jgi:hypothetical protein